MRLASLVLSAIWIGGLAALGGVAAPAVFAVLQAHDPVAGRLLAGELFGAILLRYQLILLIVGVLQLALLGARAALGPRPRRFTWQMALMTLMLAMTACSAFIITPKINAIRTSTAGSIAALPDDDLVRRRFGQLHALSTGLMALALTGALAMFWFDSRE